MSPHRRTRRTALVAGAAAVILAGAVAFLVHRSDGDGAPAAEAAGTERTAQLWHNVAECLRRHGHPTFRDPAVDSRGEPDFGAQGAQVKQAVASLGTTACRAQVAALPAAIHQRPPTAAELHQMVLFSRCMRTHGLSDWPDPRADGTFPLNQRLTALGKRRFATQMRACGPLMGSRSKGIAVSPSSVPPGGEKAITKADGQ